MSLRHNHSVTLLELLLAISLLGLMVLAFYNVDLFSRYQLHTADKRAKVQNEASYALEHIAREISKAIGSYTPANQRPIDIESIAGDTILEARIDSDNDHRVSAGDKWIAYRYTGNTGSDKYQIWYCPQCSNKPCADCTPNWNDSSNVLARNITGFDLMYPNDDPPNDYSCVHVTIIGRWDATQAASSDNPQVTLHSRIHMPATSSR